MMIALGIVIGFIVGALPLGWPGGIAGAFTGFIVMLAWRSRTQARERAMKRPAIGVASAPADDSNMPAAVARRFAAIEQRLRALERGTPDDAPVVLEEPTPARIEVPMPPPEPAPLPARDEVPAGFVRTPEGTLEPNAPRTAFASEAPAAEPRAAHATVAATPNPLWAWFTGGNALTRIGVIALFFGVGFLLKYLADIVTIPIEAKLAGVALVGAALVLLGARLAHARPGYGLSLEGAGAGILYLTTFAALRPYEVLPAPVAFVLLVAIAVLTVWLAVRSDSQPLAGLAIAGGFLAPFLVATSPGQPALLFGYFLVLNAAILALAWVRAWHGLNVLGFVFTFVLALFWGEQYYRPEHFATVEPFLVAFFAFYLAIAILYAKRGALAAKAPVDAILVFGVPLVGLALQAALVHDTRYGVAGSALAMAAVYAVLSFALHRRPEPGFALLSRAFFVLAVVFATVAIPFAADPQWTSAWWALEAAAVYWIGCLQKQWLARAFALLLQVGAAAAFVAGGFAAGERMFVNATFLGSVLIALAAIATAYVADRHRDLVSAKERSLLPLIMAWAMAWWYGGGALELARALPARTEGNAILGYAVVSVACALVMSRVLHWPRLAWFGAGLLPVMAIVAFLDWERQRTALVAYGWLVWPVAWIVHWYVLRAAEALRSREAGGDNAAIDASLRFAHAGSAIALVAWLAWEASEWVDRMFPVGTVWVACAAALPAVVYLYAAPRMRTATRWPFVDYAEAYGTSAATTIAALLAVWFVIVNVISPGSAAPLPYVPVLNPLDITLVAALGALFIWAHTPLRVEERTLYLWFGAALFVLVNAIVFRAVHQWLHVPWRLAALLASKPLQAALTLTWSATALPLMLVANRRAIRPLWMIGAAMLAVVVVKLFVIDLSSLSGLPRVVAFLGVGALLLLIGYLAPLPPATRAADDAAIR
jgi:uncharacterized membrane protein